MKKLLVVDDSNIIRKRIEKVIDTTKFELVGTAVNGSHALELFNQFKPDIITMDLTMSQMNGIEYIEKIMALNDSTKILVISALSDKSTGIEALQKGAQVFLCKPFTEDQLQHSLEEILEP